MPFDAKLLAYCGLYCDQCSAKAAHDEQDDKHLQPLNHVEGISARLKKERYDLADYDCEGCKGRNICGPCRIRECAVAKAVESCAACDAFPCPLIDGFENDGMPHHRRAVENLRTIREIGTEAWFDRLEPELRCSCGERQSWYYTCPRHS